MTDTDAPEPTEPDPAPSTLSRDELLDLCASTMLDRALGALDVVDELDAELHRAAAVAGITESEITERREHFAASRAALRGDTSATPAPLDDDTLERARRNQAVRAAIASAMGESEQPVPGAQAGRARPAGVGATGPGSRQQPPGAPAYERLRRVALVAAALVVVAGVGGLALGQLGTGSSEENAGGSAESVAADAAGADGSGIAPAPSDRGDGATDSANRTIERPDEQARAEATADPEAWIDLGVVASPAAALERWRGATASATAPTAFLEPSEFAGDPGAQACVEGLGSAGAVVVAVADADGVLLLVARDDTASMVQVIDASSCALLGSEPIG